MKDKINPKKIFDQQATSYGSWFKKSLGTEYVDRLEKKTILKILKSLDQQQLKILELGIGKGRITKYLLKKLSIEKYFGVDLSAKITKDLKKVPQIKIIIDDASKFELKEKVDAILSIRQIKYNQNYLRQLEKMHGCLRKKGLILIEFPSLFSVSGLRGIFLENKAVLFDPFKLKRELKRVGFKSFSIEALRFLPDSCYQTANSPWRLKTITKMEAIFKKLLPFWLGKSIMITAFS